MNQGDAAAGGPLIAYMQRGWRESPRGFAIFLAGVGIALSGAFGREVTPLLIGLGMIAAESAILVSTALLERRSDTRNGRPFAMIRPAAPVETRTSNEELDELRVRRLRIEEDLRALQRRNAP